MLKELRKLALLSIAITAISYGAPAQAATASFGSAGTCNGADTSGGAGADCVTTTGHISASVVGTLDINETHGLNFGNLALACGGGTCNVGTHIDLDAATGARTSANGGTDTLVLLHGAGANNGLGNFPGHANSGGQAAGQFVISDGAEGGSTQVYISFADASGNSVDYSGEDFYGANAITLTGPGGQTFTVNDFEIDCGAGSGNDVFGHYCDNAVMPLTVKVGARLNAAAVVAANYSPGRYNGTYNVMVSY